ncbi:class E sortase [Streptomyces sp. NPDC048845]
MDDPLNDPLPQPEPRPRPPAHARPPEGPTGGPVGSAHGDGYAAGEEPRAHPPRRAHARGGPYTPASPVGGPGPGGDTGTPPNGAGRGSSGPLWVDAPGQGSAAGPAAEPSPQESWEDWLRRQADGGAAAPAPRTGEETVALRVPAPPPADDETVALRVPDPPVPSRAEPVTGGRAERRRAARGGRRGGRRARRAGAAGATGAAAAGTAAEGTAAPRSRLEARRLARARRDSPGVIASRVLGETFITIGVLMLLFVTYQLWWTNILAQQQAGGAASNLQKEWDEKGEPDRSAGAFEPGQGFAIMYIPKLDVKVPIAEGIDKHKVLDRGMAGHYADGELKTAMPWDKEGNFAVAGHRNTHGEPFRYINKLDPGDPIVVETRDMFYTYEMANILPQTSPSNIGVIGPVPKGSGFTEPGRYVTLTTCTPEFTSKYRMIVWGKMVDERPRSEGKPDALVG